MLPEHAPLLPPFEHDDVARAATLPAYAYTDRTIFDAERDRIFRRTWHPVLSLADVAERGSFATTEIAGAPIVVARDLEGELRAFYNVCRHRAGPVAVGSGTKKSLTCKYHGWTYALDGALVTTPELGDARDFDRSCHGLAPVRVEAWGPFVFVNLDRDAAPLGPDLAPIAEATAHFRLSTMTRVARTEYELRCNWKTYVDNFLEGYHLPTVHPGLFEELDYKAYRVEPRGHYSEQIAPLRATAKHYAGTEGDALYYWVFPHWMLNVYPDNMSLNVVLPVAPDRTITIFEWFRNAPYEAADVEKTVRFSDEIQIEDIAICEAVQRGLASGAYERGRFSPKRENGVHHFQSLVHRALVP